METKTITISLTDFVDFSIRAGAPKLTKVKEIMNRGPYSPYMDYWKPARKGIQEFHESGSTDKEQLNDIYQGLGDRKKLLNYFGMIKAYKKFLGDKQITWFQPESNIWTNGELSVRVNPELGLEINGTKHFVKLYFKDEKLKQSRMHIVFEMMRTSLINIDNAKLSILDIANSKLITMRSNQMDLRSLLDGEAASFVSMWNSLLEQEQPR
jgi:hypothetical protein